MTQSALKHRLFTRLAERSLVHLSPWKEWNIKMIWTAKIQILPVWSYLHLKILYFLISDHLYLCDFAKRCPLSFRLNMGITCVQARVAGKKQRVAVLLGVSRELRPRPICGWVAELFCVKPIGVGRGDFVTLIRVWCQKAVQSYRIFPLG